MNGKAHADDASRGLFRADWDSVLMIHLEVDPDALQHHVPYPLDTYEGRAFVTLVAFTMRRMRFIKGGRWTRWMTAAIADHAFLNVRTYVRVGPERGIHFLAEWLPKPLSVILGRTLYCLPYHLGRLNYEHTPDQNALRGQVTDTASGDQLTYDSQTLVNSHATIAPRDSLDWFLCERYLAFNRLRTRRLKFQVWHALWPMQPVHTKLTKRDLLTKRWPLLSQAPVVKAHFCHGLKDVSMGKPTSIN